jgi:hypothetical protein
VTICIGALARDEDNSQVIVTCSDKMISNASYGSETQHKVQFLSDQLYALFSDSPARAKELELLFQDHLKSVSLTRSNLLEELEKPIVKLKRRLADSYTGRKLGVPYQYLLDNRHAWSDYVDSISKHRLRVGLIIAGFVEDQPVLLKTSDEDEESDYRLEWMHHFCAIGSGAWVANPQLHLREHDQNVPLDQALYQVYEAKRQAEISPGVGKKHTRILVLRRAPIGGIRIDVVMEPGMRHLARLYNRIGPKRVARLGDFPPGSFLEAMSR